MKPEDARQEIRDIIHDWYHSPADYHCSQLSDEQRKQTADSFLRAIDYLPDEIWEKEAFDAEIISDAIIFYDEGTLGIEFAYGVTLSGFEVGKNTVSWYWRKLYDTETDPEYGRWLPINESQMQKFARLALGDV